MREGYQSSGRTTLIKRMIGLVSAAEAPRWRLNDRSSRRREVSKTSMRPIGSRPSRRTRPKARNHPIGRVFEHVRTRPYAPALLDINMLAWPAGVRADRRSIFGHQSRSKRPESPGIYGKIWFSRQNELSQAAELGRAAPCLNFFRTKSPHRHRATLPANFF
jgi:hypothetical protein